MFGVALRVVVSVATYWQLPYSDLVYVLMVLLERVCAGDCIVHGWLDMYESSRVGTVPTRSRSEMLAQQLYSLRQNHATPKSSDCRTSGPFVGELSRSINMMYWMPRTDTHAILESGPMGFRNFAMKARSET